MDERFRVVRREWPVNPPFFNAENHDRGVSPNAEAPRNVSEEVQKKFA
jgi:hypothetical protein